MKLITRDTDYALRALCYIAQKKGAIISVRELVLKLGIPRPFLRKALQVLNRKKLLISHKGLGGGFSLLQPAEDISLLRLIEIFQGPFRLNECTFKKKPCPRRNYCRLKKRIDKIEAFVAREVSSITIGGLIRG